MLIVRNKAKVVLFALCLCLASISHAIGFGELKVYSYLNEPLVAEISLSNFKDMNPGLLKASLGDAKDFVRAGIDRPYFLTYLIFEVLSYENQLLIVVRTSKPVQTPYVEFLVELSWPEGNLIKDYTILLDPPPPTLTKESRPKSLSQVAMQSRNKIFGQDAIQQQLDKQQSDKQRVTASEDLSNVVKLAPNSFSDNTFDSSTPNEDTALVPSEVPDIEDAEQAALKAKAAAQAATEAAYQKQLSTFKQQEQQKSVSNAKQKNTTILNKIVDELEDFDAGFIPETKPITKTPVSTPAPTPVPSNLTPVETHNEEPIDFQHVIPPVTPVIAVEPSAPAVYQPPTEVKSESAASNHIYLGIILSLLLIAAGVAIAVKRMRDTKSASTATIADTFDSSEPEDFSMPADNKQEDLSDELEEIELTSPEDTVVQNDDTENKFDIKFEKIDLSELATPVIPEPVTVAELPRTEEPIIIEPPTLIKTSGLTLEPEGATLIKPLTSIVDNSEAVQVKLELAKQYLETGDKESAKEILQEIIEIANDSQRLEAHMLLSGIV